jgi:hypothetical protein
MVKRRENPLKLSFPQANAICREFLPIGDRVFDNMTRLQEAGFSAFLPRHHFIESFAANAEELEIHRRCVMENAKERLARPWPIRIYEEDFKQLYFSPFLQHLREELDKANGVPVNQLSTRYPGGESAWRREIDPCQRRLVQNSINDRELHEARFAGMVEDERRALEDEAERHASGLGKLPHTFDNKGRYAFFAAVMERDAACLGFHYDKAKSRPDYPIFSKAITEDWHLCWVIEEARAFFCSPFEGRFAPYLELRGESLRGTLAKAESGEFLHFRYATAVSGFFNGYWKFFSLNDLERAIRAHLYLYSLLAPIIEGGIAKVLKRGNA